jgi:hypothetical protein
MCWTTIEEIPYRRRRQCVRHFFWALLVLDCPVLLFGQAASRDSRTPRLCVATVSNASMASAHLDRLTERLVRNLN